MTSMVIEEFPVTLAPGRARLATSPAPTGSPTLTITSWRCPQLSYPSIQAAIGLSVVATAADELDAFVFRFRLHDDATVRLIWHLDFGGPRRKTFRKQLMPGRL
jgi:hypothetical protein